MELLLLLLPLALLGTLDFGGGDDAPATNTESDGLVRSGTSDDETINGSPGDDLILGAGGPDILRGGAGEDFLFGEFGNDTIVGNADDDLLAGGAGTDNLQGGPGDDVLLGGADRDQLFGGIGDDLLIGGSDQDSMFGAEGDDIIFGLELIPDEVDASFVADFSRELGSLIETRHGSDAADRFAARVEAAVFSSNVEDPLAPGESGQVPRADFLSGGDGNDTLVGDFGDVMTGGGTNTADLFIVNHSSSSDEPVRITDFETVDLIQIAADSTLGELSFISLDEGTLIRLGTDDVVLVEGVVDPGLLAARVTQATV